MRKRNLDIRQRDLHRLRTLLKRRCFLRGTFRLASGKTSNVYFDCKRVTLDPEGLSLISHLLLDLVDDLREEGIAVDAVGGPSVGADPLAAGVAVRSLDRGQPVPAFLVRSTIKDHGTSRSIENNIPDGASVLVVEDVVTSGRSVIEALARIREAGLKVAAVACIVDRQQGGGDALAPLRLEALFRRSELEAD